jgi:hypothetical protein
MLEWLDPRRMPRDELVKEMLRLGAQAVEEARKWHEFIAAEADDPRWSSYTLGGW